MEMEPIDITVIRQRDFLSPLFFNLIINEIIKKGTKRKFVQNKLYAM